MLSAPMIGVVHLGAPPADGEVVTTFGKVETGKVPSFTDKDRGVMFALAHMSTKSKGPGG